MNSTGDSAGVRLSVLCGPTAAGKSAFALRLARETGAAIVSADSRQVYLGFDIGTAKPSAVEQAGVPHYGIDLVAPHERFSAAAWAGAVPGWLASIASAGRQPLVVGGTGFYLRALVDPLFEEPALDEGRRAALRAVLSSLTGEDVARWAEALDPERARLGRAQRERAIEVALLTGHRISALHAARPRAARVTARYLVLDPGPGLAHAIAARVDAMLAAGWLDEIRTLTRSVPPGAVAWTATGYDIMRRVVEKELTVEQARELVIIATRQYAKRQRTWFRHQLPPDDVTRIDPREPGAYEQVAAWYAAGERERR